MVKHYFRCSTRPQHAINLAYRSPGVGRVMQNAVRIDHIKAFVTKRQALAVRDHEVAVSSVELETVARDLDRTRRQIYAGAACSAARKLQEVSAHSTPNLKQPRAAKVFESHQPRHPCGIFGVAMMLYAFEKLTRAQFMLAIVFGATRILPPLLTRPQFFLRQAHILLILQIMKILLKPYMLQPPAAHYVSTYAPSQQPPSPEHRDTAAVLRTRL